MYHVGDTSIPCDWVSWCRHHQSSRFTLLLHTICCHHHNTYHMPSSWYIPTCTYLHCFFGGLAQEDRTGRHAFYPRVSLSLPGPAVRLFLLFGMVWKNCEWVRWVRTQPEDQTDRQPDAAAVVVVVECKNNINIKYFQNLFIINYLSFFFYNFQLIIMQRDLQQQQQYNHQGFSVKEDEEKLDSIILTIQQQQQRSGSNLIMQ